MRFCGGFWAGNEEIPSSVSVRAEASVDSMVVGTAEQGVVIVNGRNSDVSYLFSLEYQGWIRADGAYVDLGRMNVNDIPIWND
jgi:hypothetical protein